MKHAAILLLGLLAGCTHGDLVSVDSATTAAAEAAKMRCDLRIFVHFDLNRPSDDVAVLDSATSKNCTVSTP